MPVAKSIFCLELEKKFLFRRQPVEQQRNRKNKIYPAKGGVVVHELPGRICLKAKIVSSGVPYVIRKLTGNKK